MDSTGGSRMGFFPRADAAVLTSRLDPPPDRPRTVGPVLDPGNADTPIESWPLGGPEQAFYAPKTDDYAPASAPDCPECPRDRYLRPFLSSNERLRLSMLWYYTRGILDDNELLSSLQEKAQIAKETSDWDVAIIGILDVNFYTRLAAVGVPLAILPRGEATCAHTINQPSSTVFMLPDLTQDWRFKLSPNVELGGLKAYAGVPLRVQDESGLCVGIGSLCVASTAVQEPLTKTQQLTLTRLADWVVSDIVQFARARRQRERRRMTELLFTVQKQLDSAVTEEPVLAILRAAYPETRISLKSFKVDHVEVEGRDPIPWSDFQDGLWEDAEYIDDFIVNSNHRELPRGRIVRVIAAQCDSISGPSVLVATSDDFQLVMDDVDAWFIESCAGMVTKIWHKRILTEAIRAKEKFLRGFSHQLRTPIHGILGSVDLLTEELRSASASLQATTVLNPGNSRVYLDTIKTAGRDLISIVNSMITLNRWADIATTERRYSTHYIGELESSLADEIATAVSWDRRYRASIFFNHNLLQDSDSVRIDLRLLRDSLLPLVINAIQNTPQGIVMVTTSTHPDHKELVVDVEDTGYGIPDEDQARIFEPYEKVSAHSTGAGLGLTLASKFAALLHGTVALISSKVDIGSHFRARFEDAHCAPSPEVVPLISRLDNLPSRFHNKISAPDTPSLSDYFERFLISHNFTASDGTENCFVILDFVPNSEQHHENLSQIPAGQIAICLVPASQDGGCFDKTPGNVVYVCGPFVTSVLVAALEEADKLLSDLKAANAPDEPASTSAEPTNGQIMAEETLPIRNTNNGSNNPVSDNSAETSSEPITQPTSRPGSPSPLESSILTLPRSHKPAALLVDDNAINLRIMQMYCSKRGLSYYCATDGLEAVQMFSKQQSLAASDGSAAIQLVLMDLQMPKCGGIDATRQIRALEKQNNWGESILFIVTGQDSSRDRTLAEGAGAHEYLVKPVSIKLLDRGVKQYFPAFQAR